MYPPFILSTCMLSLLCYLIVKYLIQKAINGYPFSTFLSFRFLRELKYVLGIFFCILVAYGLVEKTRHETIILENKKVHVFQNHFNTSCSPSPGKKVTNPILLSREFNFMQRIFPNIYIDFLQSEPKPTPFQFLLIKTFQCHLKCHSLMKPLLRTLLLITLNFRFVYLHCVCVCVRHRGFLCSISSILREQDLGFLNVFIVHISAKQKHSESVFLEQLLDELPFH